MLKTLGSTSNLWLATGPSVATVVILCEMPDCLCDLETSPGTDAWSILSRSR